MTQRPDVIIIMTDQERATPPYETAVMAQWRDETLVGRRWFEVNGVNFLRHYTGSLACVPSRPTIFTGQYPDVHGVSQTDGLGKLSDDSRMRWLREGEVPTIGHWFRAAGYDTHYDGKWHLSHADLHDSQGEVLATNNDAGEVDHAAVRTYLEQDPLGPYGFSGWVGPEPHGASLANSGVRRDPLIAQRVVGWLEDRYSRRRAGDLAALRPFLLVASFVNPHDIVLFPAWARRANPITPSHLDPPAVPPSPTDNEDLATKPAAQIAYRAAYPSAYGPSRIVANLYETRSQQYRDLYYRLHAQVDGAIDQVRRTVTENGSAEAVLVRTSDHGELLGAHGGLHQKWFNLYDEATRVPFSIVKIGTSPTMASSIEDMPTSHIDIVPTLLAAAGIDQAHVSGELEAQFCEVHPLPGRNLMPYLDGAEVDRGRSVYLITRDNMLEGDAGASGLARRLNLTDRTPAPLRIQVPAHVAANFEAVVSTVEGKFWKLVRSFDDPATWTEPFVRHLAATGASGPIHRTQSLPDQWELYNLTDDPIEIDNRWPADRDGSVFAQLKSRLDTERSAAARPRNNPWPYATLEHSGEPMTKSVPPPARLLRRGLQKLGMHPTDMITVRFDLAGKRAVVVATNTAVMDIGKPTGVFASEMTVPYYAFLDAGMLVDVASPLGGVIPVDPQSLKPVLRTREDDRFLVDDDFRRKVTHSVPIGDLDMNDYDIVFLAGGWGAAFDFGFSEVLADKMTEANGAGKVLGGVCHGPLGLRNAKGTDGEPLVKGRRISAVTDKQVLELGIESTPHHPETELRRMGARFESETKFRDPLANHWVVDGNLVTGQNQNAGPMVAREMMQLVTDRAQATAVR